MAMKYRLLGRSGLRVSELCLGTMIFGAEGWGTPPDECRKIYEIYRAEGGNFIDTANTYGSSEEILKELIASERDALVLATKYSGFMRKGDVNSAGNHRKCLIESLERSLRQLGTDYVDLFLIHTWDFMTPLDEIMRTMDDLVSQGKIRYIGISNAPAWIIARANTLADFRGWAPFVTVQVEYSLVERTVEREVLPMARALDLCVTSWAPLAAGWLTGKYGEKSAAGEACESQKNRLDYPFAAAFVERSQRNVLIAEEVIRIAREIERPPAQIALNWLRQREVIPIFGARTSGQAIENLACTDFTLTQSQIDRLDKLSRIRPGYPHEILEKVKGFTYAGMFNLITNHRAGQL